MKYGSPTAKFVVYGDNLDEILTARDAEAVAFFGERARPPYGAQYLDVVASLAGDDPAAGGKKFKATMVAYVDNDLDDSHELLLDLAGYYIDTAAEVSAAVAPVAREFFGGDFCLEGFMVEPVGPKDEAGGKRYRLTSTNIVAPLQWR